MWSESRKIIERIHDTWYLVNFVDNDFVQGNILFEAVNDVLERLGKPRRQDKEATARSKHCLATCIDITVNYDLETRWVLHLLAHTG